MIDRHRASAAASITALALTLTACGAQVISPGPITLGSGGAEPHTATCVSNLGADGSFFAGERLQNDTEETFRVVAAAANEVNGLTVDPLTGRLMAADDPHFLAVSGAESSDPVFADALGGMSPLEGFEVAPGDTVGIVIESTLDGTDFGRFASITVTYEYDGQTYQNTSSVSFEGASRSCPE